MKTAKKAGMWMVLIVMLMLFGGKSTQAAYSGAGPCLEIDGGSWCKKGAFSGETFNFPFCRSSAACAGGTGGSPNYCIDRNCNSGRFCAEPSGDVPRCELPSYSLDHCYAGGGYWTTPCSASAGGTCLGDCCLSPNAGAAEICDGQDNNCDGAVDDGLVIKTYYRDIDNDGYGNPSNFMQSCLQLPPAGYVSDSTDCNDADNSIYPGAPELCDSKDNQCPGDAGYGTVDEGCAAPPTCSDGIKNQDETDVDCGGICPACAPLPTCSDSIQNQDETGVDCGGTNCPACPSCSDGIKNQDETGVDCGGTICQACLPPPGTCAFLEGTKCNFAEICKGGNMAAATDTGLCCVGAGASCARGIFDISADFQICHSGSCACPADLDDDGVCDNLDNCRPSINCPTNPAACYNPDQKDSSVPKNGIGDACDCTIPHDDLKITKDTTLCPGTYKITDANDDGIIQFEADNAMLDCNGAVLGSYEGCNMPGDTTRNEHIDAEDAFYVIEALKPFKEYDACMPRFTECKNDCDANWDSWGYGNPDECYADYCENCGNPPVPYFDPCMDADSSGVVDDNDVQYIINHAECNKKGDIDSSGKLDNMDINLIIMLLDNSLYLSCADMDNDGNIDRDDSDALFAQITSEQNRVCSGCPEGFPRGDDCTGCGSIKCIRSSEEQLLGDFDYNGFYSQRDTILWAKMIYQRIKGDICLEFNDGIISPGDTELSKRIQGIGGYPHSVCNIPGDASGNNYLDSLDLFIISRVVEQKENPSKYGNYYTEYCTDANNDKTTNRADLQYLSNKLKGFKGTGIMTGTKSNLKIMNCTLNDYEYGMNISSYGNAITRNIVNGSITDVYLSKSSSGNKVFLNQLYKRGAADMGTDNKFCVAGKGNFYEESIGFGKIGNKTNHYDCGLSNITQPAPGALFKPGTPITISWTPQSSMYSAPVKYWLGYSADGLNWVALASNYQSLSYVWNTAAVPWNRYIIKVIPNDGHVNGTINTTILTISENGKISGTVKCNGEPVEGATVQVSGSAASTDETDSNGDYEITNAPVGRHTIIASYEGSKTQDNESYINPTDPSLQITVDFDDVCPITLDCTADCTVKGGDICMADCNGYKETDEEGNEAVCNLNTLCINVKKGLMIDNPVDPNSKLPCCQGEPVPVSAEQTDVQLGKDVQADDVITTTRIVYYNGNPVKMIIVAWE